LEQQLIKTWLIFSRILNYAILFSHCFRVIVETCKTGKLKKSYCCTHRRRENSCVFRSMVVFFALQVVEMLGEIPAVTSAQNNGG
jgi:hypothetical protein